jgi:hypothetical protein
MRPTITLLALTTLIALTGCQTWQKGGVTHTDTTLGYSLAVPAGWLFFPNMAGTPLVASKEGLILQNIRVETHILKNPLPNSKRTLVASTPPFEAAEAIVDEHKSNKSLLNLQVLENAPIDLNGTPGFRLVLDYRDSEKLHIRETRYYAISGDKLFCLIYAAPSRHYHQRDLATFEAAAKTFTLLKK